MTDWCICKKRDILGVCLCPEKRPGEDTVRGLRRRQPCRHLDLGILASRTVRRYISVVAALPAGVFHHRCRSRLLGGREPFHPLGPGFPPDHAHQGVSVSAYTSPRMGSFLPPKAKRCQKALLPEQILCPVTPSPGSHSSIGNHRQIGFFSLLTRLLDQRLAKSSVKGKTIPIFSFKGHPVSVTSNQLCCSTNETIHV